MARNSRRQSQDDMRAELDARQFAAVVTSVTGGVTIRRLGRGAADTEDAPLKSSSLPSLEVADNVWCVVNGGKVMIVHKVEST